MYVPWLRIHLSVLSDYADGVADAADGDGGGCGGGAISCCAAVSPPIVCGSVCLVTATKITNCAGILTSSRQTPCH